MSSNFILIGAAGFIAPRHLKAIKETGNVLLAAFDPHDNVGVLDSYFPDTSFFVEFERFERHIDKLIRKGIVINYCVVCSPNYLHDSHIRFALRFGINVICEKPLVLYSRNAESLRKLEFETKKKVNAILQLRLHPNIQLLKRKLESQKNKVLHDIELTYIVPRGNWYYTSWKGDTSKSGGIATNIGIHFFDMLIWLFGSVKSSLVHINSHDTAAGYLELANAKIRWFISINSQNLPVDKGGYAKGAFRSIMVDHESIDFTSGFDNLHTQSYINILDGRGFSIEDSIPSIRLVEVIRNQVPVSIDGPHHPFVHNPVSKHPFLHVE